MAFFFHRCQNLRKFDWLVGELNNSVLYCSALASPVLEKRLHNSGLRTLSGEGCLSSHNCSDKGILFLQSHPSKFSPLGILRTFSSPYHHGTDIGKFN